MKLLKRLLILARMDTLVAIAIAALLSCVSAVLFGVMFWKRYVITYQDIPGPVQSVITGNLREIRRLNKLNYSFQLILKRWHDQHGDLFKFRVLHMSIVVVADPKEIRRLLADGDRFPKSRRYEEFNQLYGTRLIPQGILVEQNQQTWLIKRRILNTFFKRSAIDEYLSCFKDAADRLVIRIQTAMAQSNGEPILLYPLLTEAALDSVLRALFNLKIDKFDGLAEKVGKIFPAMQAQLRSPIRKVFPGKKEKEVAKVLTEIRDACKDIIMENLNKNVGLLNENYCEQALYESSHIDEVVDDVLVMVLAGTDSTANTLGFLLREMCHHRPFQDRMSDEIRNAMSCKHELPTRDFLSKLVFTQQMINETLRKYPTICGTTRTCREDTMINGLKIPANTIIMISTYLVHHNGKYWKNPSSFDPERFAAISQINSAVTKAAENESNSKDSNSKKDSEKQATSKTQKFDYNQNLVEQSNLSETHVPNQATQATDSVKFLPAINKIDVARVLGAAVTNTPQQGNDSQTQQENDPIRNGCYLPFSRGQRVCIGANFAKMEMQIVLARLLSEFDFECTSNSTNFEEVLALRPDDSVPVRLTKLVKR